MDKNKNAMYASLLGLCPPELLSELSPHIPQQDIKSDWLQKELIRKAKEKRERRLLRNILVNMEQILKDQNVR